MEQYALLKSRVSFVNALIEIAKVVYWVLILKIEKGKAKNSLIFKYENIIIN